MLVEIRVEYQEFAHEVGKYHLAHVVLSYEWQERRLLRLLLLGLRRQANACDLLLEGQLLGRQLEEPSFFHRCEL